MTRSHLRNIKPTATIFNIQTLLMAVKADKAAYEGQVQSAPEWAKNHPPAVMFNALSDIESQLVSWRASGIEEVVADAPFSDGDITGDVNDTIVMQFRANRVKPVLPAIG